MITQVTDPRLIWRRIEPEIKAALERSSGRYWPSDIFDAIMQGRMQLWLHTLENKIDAVLVTEIIAWPRRRALSVVILTGENRRAWLRHLADIEDFATSHGCDLVEAWARPGWERVLQDWRKTHVLLEKDLSHEPRVERIAGHNAK